MSFLITILLFFYFDIIRMIRGKQKPRKVISSVYEKKKKPPKTDLKIQSKISTVQLRNKMKGALVIDGNYNLEKTQYSKTKEFSIKEPKSEQYNYNMPPENLTYEKLQKIFFGDLQNNLDIDLEKNADKIAKEIAEKIINIEGKKKNFANYDIDIVNSVFTKIIENTIENKELLIKNLWNILYTAHYGYDSKYKEKYGDRFDEITIGQAINDEMTNDKAIISKSKYKSIGGKYKNLSKYNLNGGSSPPPPPSPQLSNKKFFYFPSAIKLVWGAVFEMLTTPSLKEIKNHPVELLTTSPPLIYNHLEIMNELYDIKINILDSLTSSEDINKMKSEFDFVDYNVDDKFITRSIFLRRKIENEKKHAANIYSNYSINGIYNIFYKPFQDLYIYGMHNPNQYDREKLLSTMFFILEKLKIRDYIDLQDCEGGTYDLSENPYMNCNPYDRGAEREMFELALKVLLNKNIIDKKIKREYKNIKDIVDMTAGSILAWNQINDLPIASSENRMIIHCFAGKGRTGTTLLFLRLRDINDIDIVSRLNKEHFGYSNITDLIKNLSELFNPKMSSKNQEEAENNLDINYWKEVIKEVFKIEQTWHIQLLRQRLNRIFYFLAKSYKVKTFYIYVIPLKEYSSFQKMYNFSYNDIQNVDITSFFSTPRQVHINWDKFKLEKLRVHQNYIDGTI